NTYEKVFYIYLVPRDPDSKYGEYQEFFQWFKENVQSRLNKYDEQEILNTAKLPQKKYRKTIRQILID
ncbi:MAG: hypothetical protein II623_07340, partial [Paludibacteraceae bacterium]|nr:hypothetical protein [Paludibacteraceae bacterium]